MKRKEFNFVSTGSIEREERVEKTIREQELAHFMNLVDPKSSTSNNDATPVLVQ